MLLEIAANTIHYTLDMWPRKSVHGAGHCHTMNATVAALIAALRQMSMAELKEKYKELFGDESRSFNRQFLFRRIAWRLQVLSEGDLSDRARRRAGQLANDGDLKIRPPKEFHAFTLEQSKGDWRLPKPGALLRRTYKGTVHNVKRTAEGFEYNGQQFPSLSAVAFAITGTRWNGYRFFGLTGRRRG